MIQIFYACLVLLALGISLRMSLRLLYGARGPQSGDPVFQIMHVCGWALTIVPLLVLMVVGANWLSWLLIILATLSALEFVVARRAMQRQSAWALLTGKLGDLQSSPVELRSHQRLFTGIVGRAFRRLVESLEQGTSLPTAIGQHPRAVPEEAQAYAAMNAVVENSLTSEDSTTFDKDTHLANAVQNSTIQQLYQRVSYLGTVILILLGIVSFFMIKIIPSYQAIFEDFDLELPRMTQLLISLSNVFDFKAVSVGIFLGLVGFILLGMIIIILLFCDISLLRPHTDRLFYSRHRALVLRLLAIAAERGESFSELLKQQVHGELHYPSRYVRKQLSHALQAITAGDDWKSALRLAGIVKTADFPLLTTAQQAGNLPWVLRMMADQKVRSMVFRWSALEQIVFPLLILLIGLVVMFICVALFIPLVNLIQNLV